MKKTSGKKLTLGKIKIASLSNTKQEVLKGGMVQMMGTTTCVISREIACYSFVTGGGCSGDVC